jgi:hypothetical protein
LNELCEQTWTAGLSAGERAQRAFRKTSMVLVIGAIAAPGCALRAYVRPAGLPRCDRVALADITVSREAVWNGVAAASRLSSRIRVEGVEQIPEMVKRMLERAGPFVFIPESELLGAPGFQVIAQQYSRRAAFSDEAELYSPPGYPFLTDEPRRSLVKAIADATRADSVLWVRVRFEIRSLIGGMTGTNYNVVSVVELVLYDANGEDAWRDSTSAEGGPALMTGGFFAAIPATRAAQDGVVRAIEALLERLRDRVNEISGRRAP